MVRKCGAWTGIVESKRWGTVLARSRCRDYASCPYCRRVYVHQILDQVNWIRFNRGSAIWAYLDRRDAAIISTAIRNTGIEAPQTYWWKWSFSKDYVMIVYLPFTGDEEFDNALSAAWPTQKEVEALAGKMSVGRGHKSTGKLGALV